MSEPADKPAEGQHATGAGADVFGSPGAPFDSFESPDKDAMALPECDGPSAIDDQEDLPDDLVQVQKTISGERKRRRPSNSVQFGYRLAACPELCMGVFCTVAPKNAKDFEIETMKTAHPVETNRDDGAVGVLMAHIIATRSNDKVVTDAAMDYPRDYATVKQNTTGLGHHELGRTVCIHSLAVHPKLQGCGMGKLIMKSYLQQIKSAGLADRISLICESYLVNYYRRFGFEHVGESQATFGGGGWHDMVG
ncbi:hypothetical protein F5Y15DRAFT_411436 [Xylariaceae sp. FL0016]|nr:hypothetical protein F5Y15DRAFT_411436 [Xylariaceae sp. FL0016]